MKIRIVEYGYESTEVVSDWFEATEEEYDIIKAMYPVQVDHGKEHYLKTAKAAYERNQARDTKRKEAEAKRAAEKEAKDLERKRKQFEKLKKELGE